MKDFIKKIITLDNIKQWEERDSVIKETVSQHSFKVSAICVCLLERINEKSYLNENWRWGIFYSKVVKYAVLHDFDESVLGRDISHVVKYNSRNGDKIRKVLDDFVDYELSNMNLKFVKENDSEVKMFVKLCDWLALLTFIVRNKRMGCSDFSKEEKYCIENVKKNVESVRSMIEKKFGDYLLDLDFFNNLISDVYGE